MAKFEFAPGLPGYGTRGVDGSSGFPGISMYFSAYDGDDSISIKSKILDNKVLFPNIDEPLGLDGPIRTFQDGDQFVDRNGRIYLIDFSHTNLYYATGQNINTAGFFAKGSLTGLPTYERWSNDYTITKSLVDIVYVATPISDYANPEDLYGIGAKDYAQIKHVNNPKSGYHPYTIWTNTNSPVANDMAIALVKEDGNNVWRWGNLDSVGAQRDVSLHLDFGDIFVNGTMHGDIDGTITGDIDEDQIQASLGLSVLGRSANSPGTVASIQGTANQVLRVSPGPSLTVGFGSINLAQSAAVGSSVLNIVNGGTGKDDWESHRIVYAPNTSSLSQLPIGTAGQVLSSEGPGNDPTWQTISVPSTDTISVIDGTAASPSISFQNSTGTGIFRSAADELSISTAGTHRFKFTGADFHARGNIIAYSSTTWSDERLKKDIANLENSLDRILSLRGVSYTRREDNTSHIGFIAQEVEKVIPEAVSEYELNWEENLGIYKALNYEAIIPILAEAIKEQQKTISDQQKAIDYLISEVEKINNKIN
jgi:hypothetical protein